MTTQLLEFANTLWKTYNEMLKQNPVIAGGLTLYGMGMATYLLRDLPARWLNYVKSQFTVAVAVHNNDMLFTYVTDWLEGGDKVFRCKNFAAVVHRTDKKATVAISVGYGNHIFFYKRRPYWLSRVEKEANATTDRKESLYISTYGWSPQCIREFLQEVVPQPKSEGRTILHNFEGSYWYGASYKQVRKLDSVVLTDENEKKVRNHISQYLKSKEWYKKHLIPWRTGILLEGPPGTGKSSLSLALCGEFDCNLFIASLGLAGGDKLLEMFKRLPPKSILLIEDIDAYAITNTRKKPNKKEIIKKQQQKVIQAKNEGSDVDEDGGGGDLFGSLSALLNAIDGLSSTEDRILIATTNHVERLDPALIRPGRFELILKIDYLNNETARKMFTKFYPTFVLPANFEIKEEISPAEFQTMAMGNKENPEVLVQAFKKEETNAKNTRSVPKKETSGKSATNKGASSKNQNSGGREHR